MLSQLGVLGDLISKTAEDEEYSLTEQGVTKKKGRTIPTDRKRQRRRKRNDSLSRNRIRKLQAKDRSEFHSPQALRRRKITYTLIGAGGGFSAFFFLCAIFTIFSRLAFNSPGFFIGDGLLFAVMLLVFAPAAGAIAGYLGGQRKNFKRPEPEWNEE